MNVEFPEGQKMSPEHWWKINLRLKLRQSSGDEFQHFFSAIMEKQHGGNFVRIRPFGALGDKGCDGYLKSSGIVFQCYGAVNGDKNKVGYLISKMETDFGKARSKVSDIMKEWVMVHNLVDGLPIEAVQTLGKIERENPEVQFAFFGLERFENAIDALTDEQKSELLGAVATNRDAQNLQVDELKFLIDDLVRANEDTKNELNQIVPVSEDKLQTNGLPVYWHDLISGGWRNAHLVSAYFNEHHEPLRGERIATMFRDRYDYLKSQKLGPASIMDSLYEFVTGIGSVPPERQVAAQALLAHLFASCDIFENMPESKTS